MVLNPFTKRSDREIVDSLRRAERLRRPVGVAFIVLGVLILLLHAWGVVWMERKARQIADALERHQTMPADLRDASAAIQYATGFRSGVLLIQGAVVGTLLLVNGIRLRFGGRKDRLLIDLFDSAANAGYPAP